VTAADQLQSLMERSQVGQSLQVTIRRGDRTQQLSVQAAEMQGDS